MTLRSSYLKEQLPVAMTTLPELPARVENAQHFAELVSNDPEAWYLCTAELHECATGLAAQVTHLSRELTLLNDQQSELQEQLDNKTLENVAVRTRTAELERGLQNMRSARDKLAGTTEYQDTQLSKQSEEIFQLRRKLETAMVVATPAVSTPASVPTIALPAEAAPAVATAETPITPAQSSASSRLSERLPDPAIFDGDRKDFRRFQAKIYQKMKTNADRFPTARERMSYVTNRLEGQAYAQILPFIMEGECQLPDYPDVLRILERAYGDPNRVNNARKDLFRLKQQNREFAAFYAEFQRLALEGEVSEDSQITLLESALSRELKAQLTSVDAPDHDIHKFSEFLQKLENKRRYYNDLTDTRPVRAAPTATSARPIPARAPMVTTTTQMTSPTAGEPMDLSASRRPPPGYQPSGRRERGECYRCGSPNHRVANCPLPPPANRPAQIRETRAASANSYAALAEENSRPASPAFTERSAKGGASI